MNNKTDNEEIRKLAISIYLHDAYLTSLKIDKENATSEEVRKELKKLIKEAKAHSKKLNKLFKKVHGTELSDRLIKQNNKEIKSRCINKALATTKGKADTTEDDVDTTEDRSKHIKNTDDSTNYRDKLLENTKKATKISGAEHTDVVLNTIECDYTIKENEDKLPVDCEMLGIKCVFTPQHTVIIKAGSKLVTDIIESKEGLSKLTKANIAKAIERQDLRKVQLEDGNYVFAVEGDFTCSSRADAARVITGKAIVKNCNFFVGNLTLSEYLVRG